MLDKVKWDPEDRSRIILEMKEFFRSRLDGYEGVIQRPDVKAFSTVLRRVSGCPGLDGWSTFEATSVADNKYLCAAAWEEMHLWEECGCAPSSLLDILLLFVPKAGRNFDKGYGESSDFRPLSIFSIFWRAWSSTWVTADCFHEFIQAKLPLGLTASHRGGTGAEALAAVCAHQLDKLGYGCTLDFSACFDTCRGYCNKASQIEVLSRPCRRKGGFWKAKMPCPFDDGSGARSIAVDDDVLPLSLARVPLPQ